MMKQHQFRMQSLALALALAFAATTASAAVIASETFGYGAAAELIGQTGGTGWSSTPWADGAGNTTGTRNLKVVNNHAEVSTDRTNSASLVRELDTPNVLKDQAGNTYYLSIDMQSLSDASNPRFIGIGIRNGSTPKMLFGSNSNHTDWTVDRVLDNSSTQISLNSGIDCTDAATLLLKVVMGGSGVNEQVTFWVNPNLAAAENAADAVGGQSFQTSLDWGDITSFTLGGGNTSGSSLFRPFTADNFVITDSSPFAAPEPSGWSLLGVVMALALLRKH